MLYWSSFESYVDPSNLFVIDKKNGKEEFRVFHGKKKKEERDAKSNPEINRHLITVPAYIRGPYKIIFFLYTFQA